MRAKLLSFVVLIALFILLFQGQQANALQVPALSGRVVDTAGILSSSSKNVLNLQLQQLEQQDSTQIVVLTIPSLEGENLEEYALKVAETWKIGQKEVDNGVLLLVAIKDRKLRIEVGYGLEGRLTDLMAGRIIRNRIVPEFRRGQYDQGVLNGVDAIIKTVKGEYTTQNIPTTKKKQDPGGVIAIAVFGLVFIGNVFRKKAVAGGIAGGIFGLILWGTTPLFPGLALLPIVILFGVVGGALATLFFGATSSRSRSIENISSGRGFKGRGFSGGGFSGGGGGFGGGGASGGW